MTAFLIFVLLLAVPLLLIAGHREAWKWATRAAVAIGGSLYLLLWVWFFSALR